MMVLVPKPPPASFIPRHPMLLLMLLLLLLLRLHLPRDRMPRLWWFHRSNWMPSSLPCWVSLASRIWMSTQVTTRHRTKKHVGKAWEVWRIPPASCPCPCPCPLSMHPTTLPSCRVPTVRSGRNPAMCQDRSCPPAAPLQTVMLWCETLWPGIFDAVMVTAQSTAAMSMCWALCCFACALPFVVS